MPSAPSRTASLTVKPSGDQTIPAVKRVIYEIKEAHGRKVDFTYGVCCVLQGPVYALLDKAGTKLFRCTYSNQSQVFYNYDRHDEVISKFIHLKYTGEEDRFGDADITIAIPHCLSRSSALYREPVIKAKYNNSWVVLNTEESASDDFKEGRFVEATFSGGIPSHVCVVSRFKQDTLKFTRKPSRNTWSVDQRFCLKSEQGAFHGKVSFPMQVQPVDLNTVTRVQNNTPDGLTMMCSSNIVSISWGDDKFKKPLTVNLPIPANPAKVKKLAKAEAMKAEVGNEKEKKRRQDTKKEDKSTKWYMGVYGEDENDSLLLFNYDVSADSWTPYTDSQPVEIRKDVISFHMTRPLHRFIALRCRQGVAPVDARKLVIALEEQLSLRPVKFILIQNPKDHSEVTVHCVGAAKFEALYEELYDKGWRFHGTSGPPKSKEVMVKEGSVFEIGFRGNIKFDERFHPPNKKVLMYYNSQLSCQLTFSITETDKHLQKTYDFYKGVCMIQLMDKPYVSELPQIPVAGHMKSSSGSLHVLQNKKVSAYQTPERKRVMCELMLQLAKGYDYGPQTPSAGKLCINLDPIYVEAIEMLSAKLGKEWEVLAKNLGLTRGRIEALKTRNKLSPDLLKSDMLYTWIKRQPRAADRLPRLYYALMNCGRIDLAYKIEDIYCGDDDLHHAELTVATDHTRLSTTSRGRTTSTVQNNNVNNAITKSLTTQKPKDETAGKQVTKSSILDDPTTVGTVSNIDNKGFTDETSDRTSSPIKEEIASLKMKLEKINNEATGAIADTVQTDKEEMVTELDTPQHKLPLINLQTVSQSTISGKEGVTPNSMLQKSVNFENPSDVAQRPGLPSDADIDYVQSTGATRPDDSYTLLQSDSEILALTAKFKSSSQEPKVEPTADVELKLDAEKTTSNSATSKKSYKTNSEQSKLENGEADLAHIKLPLTDDVRPNIEQQKANDNADYPFPANTDSSNVSSNSQLTNVLDALEAAKDLENDQMKSNNQQRIDDSKVFESVNVDGAINNQTRNVQNDSLGNEDIVQLPPSISNNNYIKLLSDVDNPLVEGQRKGAEAEKVGGDDLATINTSEGYDIITSESQLNGTDNLEESQKDEDTNLAQLNYNSSNGRDVNSFTADNITAKNPSNVKSQTDIGRLHSNKINNAKGSLSGTVKSLKTGFSANKTVKHMNSQLETLQGVKSPNDAISTEVNKLTKKLFSHHGDDGSRFDPQKSVSHQKPSRRDSHPSNSGQKLSNRSKAVANGNTISGEQRFLAGNASKPESKAHPSVVVDTQTNTRLSSRKILGSGGQDS